MRLAGKTILVTAAAQGMGRASAIACAKQGAKVIATDINLEMLQTLKRESELIDVRFLDVTDSGAIRSFAQSLTELDGLFNCAGIVHHGDIQSVSDEDWEMSLKLNITSTFTMCREMLPLLLASKETGNAPSIVNMSSMASSIKGFPVRAAYGATKAAVLGLTKSIAADYVGEELRCNAICPGTVDTPSLRGRIAAASDPVQAEKDFINRQPMKRLAVVDDISPLVVYLLSDESRYVTGQAMSIDGGVTI
ncbi:SDR family oxidoreductase [Vibrio amylolyticus]|uniref:SDR family oxidoreductase n=1 Tax=Vibrio amylolyticus TaxID=2847292 RepID=UPI003550B9A5